MIRRRDALIAAACLGAAGGAYALEPRRRLSLLGEAKLDDLIPRQVNDWTSHDVTDLVAPREEDSLAARLYSQTVGRVYQQGSGGPEIMMLAAYGETESNELQLHRPESCYPAVGFEIVANAPVRVPVSAAAFLPARRLIAEAPGRREFIVYWSRIGEHLPVDSSEQRLDRVRTAMAGYVPDGLLMRLSAVEHEASTVFTRIESFISALLRSVPPAQRPALIGSRLARSIA
jgi:EpsI family protein